MKRSNFKSGLINISKTQSLTIFSQESCGYVTQKCDLVCGLSVETSLMYAASLSLGNKVAHYVKVILLLSLVLY